MKPFGSGSRRICAVAAAATAGEMRALVLEGLRHATTIELRLDWLRNDRERFAFLKWLKRSAPRKAVFLATCRRRICGRRGRGTVLADPSQTVWLCVVRSGDRNFAGIAGEIRAGLRRSREGAAFHSRFSAHPEIAGANEVGRRERL